MGKRKNNSEMECEFGDLVDSPEMNESMIKHISGEVPSTIREFGCMRNGKNCIYMDDCNIKNYYDNVLWNALKADTIVSIEIKFCHHYEIPEKSISEKVKSMELMEII